MSVPQLSAEQRGEQILAVFDTAFGELLAADPAAFRVKFRKMAASAVRLLPGHGVPLLPRPGRARRRRRRRTWTSAPAGCGSTATCTPRTSAPTWTPTAG